MSLTTPMIRAALPAIAFNFPLSYHVRKGLTVAEVERWLGSYLNY